MLFRCIKSINAIMSKVDHGVVPLEGDRVAKVNKVKETHAENCIGGVEPHATEKSSWAGQPIFKAFWDFQRTKMGHHNLKTVQKHLF